jgi:hypothetical protein
MRRDPLRYSRPYIYGLRRPSFTSVATTVPWWNTIFQSSPARRQIVLGA